MDGTKVAQLVFPSDPDAPLDDVVLQLLPGIKLDKSSKRNDEAESTPSEPNRRQKIYRWLVAQRNILAKRQKLPDLLRGQTGVQERHGGGTQVEQSEDSLDIMSNDPSIIMSYIPAIQHGSVPMVTERLQSYLKNRNISSD